MYEPNVSNSNQILMKITFVIDSCVVSYNFQAIFKSVVFPYSLELSWEMVVMTSFLTLQIRMGKQGPSLVPSTAASQSRDGEALYSIGSKLAPSLPLCPPRLLDWSSGPFPGSEHSCHILAP